MDTQSGEPLLLHGINLSGLEYREPGDTGFLAAARFTRDEIWHLVRDLGCNVLRIPFNQDWALRGRGVWSAESYLETLDLLVNWVGEAGAYALLDLQWLDADTERGGHRQFVAPLPNAESIVLWRLLAERYRGCAWVLYDLFNEPHDRLPGDPVLLRDPDNHLYLWPWRRRVSPGVWKPWAIRLIDAIRDIHPDSLIFVGGTNWAYDLRNMLIERSNIVYSTHVYPDKRPDWRRAFGDFSQDHAVFVGELGGIEKDLSWGRELLQYLAELRVGWCAWSWRDAPHLQVAGVPTPFGALVLQSLHQQSLARRSAWKTPEPSDRSAIADDRKA